MVEKQKMFPEVADALLRYRKRAKLTQKQLADKSGVTSAYISKIEKGISDVKLSTIEKLCAVLGCEFVLLDTHLSVNREYTMKEFADLLNSSVAWRQEFSCIIRNNGWSDLTHQPFGICENSRESIHITQNGKYVYTKKNDPYETIKNFNR